MLFFREFRPLLKDCYSQDTSQSSRLCFELKRSEAQNLCRLFNAASARVNLGAGATRTAARPAASGSKASGSAAPSSQGEASTSDVSHCCVFSLSQAAAVERHLTRDNRSLHCVQDWLQL